MALQTPPLLPHLVGGRPASPWYSRSGSGADGSGSGVLQAEPLLLCPYFPTKASRISCLPCCLNPPLRPSILRKGQEFCSSVCKQSASGPMSTSSLQAVRTSPDLMPPADCLHIWPQAPCRCQTDCPLSLLIMLSELLQVFAQTLQPPPSVRLSLLKTSKQATTSTHTFSKSEHKFLS